MMARTHVPWLVLVAAGLLSGSNGRAQNTARPGVLPAFSAATDDNTRRFPINLPTALKLAQAQPIDIQMAAERIQQAQAQLDRSRVAWMPTIVWGLDYARHDGRIQDIVGSVINTNRSSLMFGAGPNVVFSASDALFAPLAARRVLQSRQASHAAALNDTTFTVAETYFQIQQARGELASASASAAYARELVIRTEKLSAGLASPIEVNRAKTEHARRRLDLERAQERWQTASAELARVLQLTPTALVEPVESPSMRINLIDGDASVDDLISIGLKSRPELSAQQALVEATLDRLRQERLRPLMPSVLLRGNATNPSGAMSGGVFGGGVDGSPSAFGGRYSFDLQVVWELQNLGLANRAATRERRSENRQALLEVFRTQDRIAAEVVQAHARSRRATSRVALAEEAVAEAHETATKGLEALGQTRRVGEVLVLVFRPQEAAAAIQALDQVYREFFTAVADANRAQFALYRALGYPANKLSADLNGPTDKGTELPMPRSGPTPFTPPP